LKKKKPPKPIKTKLRKMPTHACLPCPRMDNDCHKSFLDYSRFIILGWSLCVNHLFEKWSDVEMGNCVDLVNDGHTITRWNQSFNCEKPWKMQK
jgi:hypothetical protein